ncbi:MAG TPA: hypothetical protein VK644_07220 [Chitinophagaceae bacterium]|nr:hypothetical protein [Chitinophagaceae bacterium]
MRKFFSERNLAGILFIVAFVVFFLAKQDSYAVEQILNKNMPSASGFAPAPTPTANLSDSTTGKASQFQ